MKIALLQGAYKNAGDYLIVNRSKQLLKHIYPECTIIEYERKKQLTQYLDEINGCDVLVIAGGPGYITNVYPNIIPLISNLEDLRVRIFVLGMGWYGGEMSNNVIYNYKFSEQTKKLFKKIEDGKLSFGCRDIESMRVLKNNGFMNTIMTGCPAWYDLENINNLGMNKKITKTNLKRISISDPGNPKYHVYAIRLVQYLIKKYPNAEIKFFFHRGIEADLNTSQVVGDKNKMLKGQLENLGVDVIDISYGYEGFSLYDNCDIHIGFRVHAHIYNLSKRNASILIEEDGRGAGVNKVLGLEHIKVYEEKVNFDNNYFMKIARRLINWDNKYFEENIDDYMYELFNDDFKRIEQAYAKMNSYYKNMVKHIKSIENL